LVTGFVYLRITAPALRFAAPFVPVAITAVTVRYAARPCLLFDGFYVPFLVTVLPFIAGTVPFCFAVVTPVCSTHTLLPVTRYRISRYRLRGCSYVCPLADSFRLPAAVVVYTTYVTCVCSLPHVTVVTWRRYNRWIILPDSCSYTVYLRPLRWFALFRWINTAFCLAFHAPPFYDLFTCLPLPAFTAFRYRSRFYYRWIPPPLAATVYHGLPLLRLPPYAFYTFLPLPFHIFPFAVDYYLYHVCGCTLRVFLHTAFHCSGSPLRYLPFLPPRVCVCAVRFTLHTVYCFVTFVTAALPPLRLLFRLFVYVEPRLRL